MPKQKSRHAVDKAPSAVGPSLCVLLAVTLLTPVSGAAAGWETISTDTGVKVTTKNVPGRALPVFQGDGLVQANIYEVLAVISDVARHCEWRPKCAGVKLLARTGPQELIMWSRNAAPWPVNDRDVVVKAKVRFDPRKSIFWSTFKRTTHAKMPPITGVVRVPHIEGFYRLRRVDENTTAVRYRVNADPGGWIPTWLAARSSRGLPRNTIIGLRKQTQKMTGKYGAFVRRWKAVAEPAPALPTPTSPERAKTTPTVKHPAS